MGGHASESGIDQREQAVQRVCLANAGRTEQLGNLAGLGLSHGLPLVLLAAFPAYRTARGILFRNMAAPGGIGSNR